jgi:hypothetical protein
LTGLLGAGSVGAGTSAQVDCSMVDAGTEGTGTPVSSQPPVTGTEGAGVSGVGTGTSTQELSEVTMTGTLVVQGVVVLTMGMSDQCVAGGSVGATGVVVVVGTWGTSPQ